MGGPSVSRQNINTAAMPNLSGNLEGLLQGFLSTGANPFSQANQPSDLQRQAGGAFEGLLSRGDQSANMIQAALPVFQQNQQMGADILRQSGPRFNSNTERLVADQNVRGMNDFNVFQQNVMQQGQQQHLANIMGAAGFANQMQGQQLGANQAIMQALLGLSGQAGIGPAALVQKQGTTQDVLQGVGAFAQLIGALNPMKKG